VAQSPHNWNPKPNGLWLSDVTQLSWKDWVAENVPEYTAHQQNEYEIELFDDANLLTLSTPLEMESFTQAYAEPLASEDGKGKLRPGRDNENILWHTVAQNYQGILITPYMWRCRMSMFWYYGWDIASGCIWDASVFKKFELIVPG
jgi:hypothetical protein